MQQTMEWLDGIAAQDKLVDHGNGLSFDDARVIKHGWVVTNGPFGDIIGTISGYVL